MCPGGIFYDFTTFLLVFIFWDLEVSGGQVLDLRTLNFLFMLAAVVRYPRSLNVLCIMLNVFVRCYQQKYTMHSMLRNTGDHLDEKFNPLATSHARSTGRYVQTLDIYLERSSSH
jgi:hypothetical protein